MSKLEQIRANGANTRAEKNRSAKARSNSGGKHEVKPPASHSLEPSHIGKILEGPSGRLAPSESTASGLDRSEATNSKNKGGRRLAKDADKALMQTKPWQAEGMSRASWYRRQKEQRK